MAQPTHTTAADLPPLAPEWLLQPLTARDEASADLDPTDSRFTAMLDLVTRGDYVMAGHRAEQALQDGLMDIRVLGYYLFGYFVEKGPTSTPILFRILGQILGEAQAAIGPRDKREVHIENTLQWLFQSLLRNVEHHSRSQDATWKTWMDSATRPAIDEALELSAALQAQIAQHSPKQRASTRFQSVEAWLRGLEKPAPAPPPAPPPATSAEAARDADKARSGKNAEAAATPSKERPRSARERAEDAKRYSLSLDLGDGNVSVLRPASTLKPDPIAEDEAALRDEDEDESEDAERRSAGEPDEDSGPADSPRSARGTRDRFAAPFRLGDDDDPTDEDLDLQPGKAMDQDTDEDAEEDAAEDAAEDADEGDADRARGPRAPSRGRAELRLFDGAEEEDRRPAPRPGPRQAAGPRPAGRGPRPPEPAQAAAVPGLDGDVIAGSEEWHSLLRRLQGFERLLESGDYLKAAVLAHDIQQAISSFDPVRYFPSLFAGYLAAFSTHMHPLEACLKDSGSVQFKVLQKLFQVSPDEFLRRR
jgi:hypothetical protein